MAEHVYTTPKRSGAPPDGHQTAVIIPFIRKKTPPSLSPWAQPPSIERTIRDVAALSPGRLIPAASQSLDLAMLPRRDDAATMACALKAMLCLARALDEAGFPVVLAEGRA